MTPTVATSSRSALTDDGVTEGRGVPAYAADDTEADAEDDDVEDRAPKQGLMRPASMGLRFQVPADLDSFRVVASWGTYETVETDKVTKAGRPVREYHRAPVEVTRTVHDVAYRSICAALPAATPNPVFVPPSSASNTTRPSPESPPLVTTGHKRGGYPAAPSAFAGQGAHLLVQGGISELFGGEPCTSLACSHFGEDSSAFAAFTGWAEIVHQCAAEAYAAAQV